jgi:acetyl esterase/lipase
LLLTWPGLAWSIFQSLTRSTGPTETALCDGLGLDYRSAIPAARSATLRGEVRFDDWRHPFGFRTAGVERLSDIAYGPHGRRQHLDVYRPVDLPEEGCPVLLQIHGGAWMVGSKDHQALPLMWTLASRGWVCVAANYRLSPSVGFPTHLEDCKRALCWIREHGREYGMNPDFVAVTGGSAGAHLATLLALTANDPRYQHEHPDTDTSVQACIPFYGVYDFLVRNGQHPNAPMFREFLEHRVMHQTLEQNPELWDEASPITKVQAGAPPFMIVHGTLDSLALIEDARVFYRELKRTSSNPVVFLELPGAEHAFDIVRSPRTEAVVDGVHRFLEWARAARV